MDPEILGTLGELERKLAELERTIATLERMEGGSEHREPPAGDGAGEPAAEPAGASGSRLVDESVTGAPAPPADEPTRGRAYTGPAAATISFARGAPSLDIIDVQGLRDAAVRALESDPAGATAYGTSVGYPRLRSWIADRHGVEPERVLVTNGSMQADAFLFQHLVHAGEDVVVESPTYDRTLLSLRGRGARVHAIALEDAWIDTRRLARQLSAGRLLPRLAHIIPNFQNPAGYTLSLEKREELLALAAEYEFVVFEDDPYVALRFRGESLPTMLSMDPDRVVYASSFSKTVCPGVRVGYLVGPPALIGAVSDIARDTYISPSMISQAIVYEFCASGAIERSIETVREALRERADTLAHALRRELPEARFRPPVGALEHDPLIVALGEHPLEARLEPRVLEVVQNALALVLEAQHRHRRPHLHVGERHAFEARACHQRMPVRARVSAADRREHALFEVRRHRVLEPLGLLVHLVPRHAEDVREETLDQAMAAHDLRRVRRAGCRERDRALAVARDVPVVLEAHDHLVHRRRRELHRARDVRAGHRQARLLKPVEALQVLLLSYRRPRAAHSVIVEHVRRADPPCIRPGPCHRASGAASRHGGCAPRRCRRSRSRRPAPDATRPTRARGRSSNGSGRPCRVRPSRTI